MEPLVTDSEKLGSVAKGRPATSIKRWAPSLVASSARSSADAISALASRAAQTMSDVSSAVRLFEP